MKKQTVYGWLYRQREQVSRKEPDPICRVARLAALAACERWLFAFPWAQMRTPVREQRGHQQGERLALLEKKAQESLTEAETCRLQELQASDEIYEAFLRKITPTARRAEIERKYHQQERARRADAHH